MAEATVREQLPERGRDDLWSILFTATLAEWADVLEWLNTNAETIPPVFERARRTLEYTLGRELLRDLTEPTTRTFTVEFSKDAFSWKPEGHVRRFLRKRGWRG